jgi:hypothetical protein
VPDDRDACPADPGPAENRGCPLPPSRADRDGDGVLDLADACPDVPGPAENGGCPLPPPPTEPPPPPPTEPPPPPKVTDPPPTRGDRDGDGVPDDDDACPGDPGPAENRGCPTR